MNTQVARFVGAVAGFAFAALWVAAGFEAAVFCVLAGGLGFAAVAYAQRSSWKLPALDLAALQARFTRPDRTTKQAPPRRRPRPLAADPASADGRGYGW